jgi:hypothetical protein
MLSSLPNEQENIEGVASTCMGIAKTKTHLFSLVVESH